MTIKLVAYGIAKDILKGKEKEVELNDQASLAELRSTLINCYPEFSKLKSLSFAIGEEYRKDDFLLTDRCEVVLIPPVSGG